MSKLQAEAAEKAAKVKAEGDAQLEEVEKLSDKVKDLKNRAPVVNNLQAGGNGLIEQLSLAPMVMMAKGGGFFSKGKK